MRRVAQQGGPAVDPVHDGITVAQDPQFPVLALFYDLPGDRVHMLEATAYLVMADRFAGNGFRCVIVVGDNQVEDFPARQRIVDDMAFRAGP